jgi:hypothetical protein
MLTKLQIASFNQNGFLSAAHALNHSPLVRIKAEYTDLLDQVFPLAWPTALPDTGSHGCKYASGPVRNWLNSLINQVRKHNQMPRLVPKD